MSDLRPGESYRRMGCGQPQWHHDPAYCGPECSWYEPPDDDEDDQPDPRPPTTN